MKQIILILSVLVFTTGSKAQAQRAERNERIHAIKVGYLTDRLKLTSAQAATFWPVYNSFENELKTARKAFRQKNQPATAAENDAAASRYIEDNLDLQEQTLDINRKYKDQFLKVISPQQLATLYDAERDFKKLLLQRLQERRQRRE